MKMKRKILTYILVCSVLWTNTISYADLNLSANSRIGPVGNEEPEAVFLSRGMKAHAVLKGLLMLEDFSGVIDRGLKGEGRIVEIKEAPGAVYDFRSLSRCAFKGGGGLIPCGTDEATVFIAVTEKEKKGEYHLARVFSLSEAEDIVEKDKKGWKLKKKVYFKDISVGSKTEGNEKTIVSAPDGDTGLIGGFVFGGGIEFIEEHDRAGTGYVKGRAYHIKDPSKKEIDIKIPAKRAKRSVFAQFEHTGIGEIDLTLDRFLARFDGEILILRPNEYGIKGIGTGSMLAVGEGFENKGIALFHELAHAAGINMFPFIKDGERSLADYIYEHGRGYRLDPSVRAHYALRIFQKQMWPEKDTLLTDQIRLEWESLKVLIKKLISAPGAALNSRARR
ncbi:MAG: hypothetical protein ABH883_00650, partial [Candidatus Omnitrophota bacterium]